MTRREPVSVEIGIARADELPGLPALEMRAGQLFRTVGRPEVAEGEPRPVSELRESHGRGDVIVARCMRPVGFALVEAIDAGLHLDEMSVDPAWARRGVGTRLLAFVVDLAARRGHSAVTLTTFADVPWNGPWYRRQGFEPLPSSAWTADLRARVAEEATWGLDPAERWVMRRRIG